MRIAVSGSHCVGKTTLTEALGHVLPKYDVIPEPYHLLEEDGHAFAEMPSLEDFELQLERSLQCIQQSGTNVIFDRCPLDILGYLLTHRDTDAFALEDWMHRMEAAVAELDSVVYVPIEAPDRIAVSPAEVPFRAEVDAILRDIVVDDAYGLGFEVIPVAGTVATRLQQVVSQLKKDR